MAKNKLTDLRDHLFETLESLKDKDNPMELDRAKAVCGVAQQIIDSAKVEVDFLEVTGELPADEFFGSADNFRASRLTGRKEPLPLTAGGRR